MIPSSTGFTFYDLSKTIGGPLSESLNNLISVELCITVICSDSTVSYQYTSCLFLFQIFVQTKNLIEDEITPRMAHQDSGEF